MTKTMFDPKIHGSKDGLWTCEHIRCPEQGVTSGSQPAIDPCPWCEIERLRGLLRRALPDLKWAEKAADQEYSSSLDDMEIVRDIEAEIEAVAADPLSCHAEPGRLMCDTASQLAIERLRAATCQSQIGKKPDRDHG